MPCLRLAAVFCACAFLELAASGCRSGTSIGKSRGDAPASPESQRVATANDLNQKGGGCDLNKRVVDPEEGTAEWVIWRAYQLALGPDSDTAFTDFAALFGPDRNLRELKDMYWTRLRANVHKFLIAPGKPDFTICRSAQADHGRKYFIVTADARQMPPPITVGEVDGHPRILFLTPF